MDTVYVSALAALGGSAIGALASIGTSWLTQRYQNQSQRAAEKSARLEQIFGEFIDQGDGKYSALPMSTIVAKEQETRVTASSTRCGALWLTDRGPEIDQFEGPRHPVSSRWWTSAARLQLYYQGDKTGKTC